MTNKNKTFEEFAKFNTEIWFYGVDNNVMCLQADRWESKKIAFEALEDENDGYRSMLEELREVPVENYIFFQTPIALVRVEEIKDRDGFYGWQLVDVKTQHVWLRFGTEEDDCYPQFIFSYMPDKNQLFTNDTSKDPLDEKPIYISDKIESHFNRIFPEQWHLIINESYGGAPFAQPYSKEKEEVVKNLIVSRCRETQQRKGFFVFVFDDGTIQFVNSDRLTDTLYQSGLELRKMQNYEYVDVLHLS
jgi:hypothetical protein